jgi:hypothetical protein
LAEADFSEEETWMSAFEILNEAYAFLRQAYRDETATETKDRYEDALNFVKQAIDAMEGGKNL